MWGEKKKMKNILKMKKFILFLLGLFISLFFASCEILVSVKIDIGEYGTTEQTDLLSQKATDYYDINFPWVTAKEGYVFLRYTDPNFPLFGSVTYKAIYCKIDVWLADHNYNRLPNDYKADLTLYGYHEAPYLAIRFENTYNGDVREDIYRISDSSRFKLVTIPKSQDNFPDFRITYFRESIKITDHSNTGEAFFIEHAIEWIGKELFLLK
jgi:hypothetical protein